jgi:two-component system, NtrC family, nitrogen regulation response regulator GlnG
MSAKPRILLAHNDRLARETLARDLTQNGYAVRATAHFDTLWRWVKANEGDLILIDVDIPDPARNGFELLKQIRQAYPDIPALVLSAENTVLTSLLAARFGAFDYFPKPFSFAQLTASMTRALNVPKAARKKQQQRKDLPLIGSSNAMQDVYRQLAQATQTDLPVLITGETGTGKSLIATLLHNFGNQREAPVSIIHFPLSDDAFEREVMQGANRANKGTLVLDEISALTPTQQAGLTAMLGRLDGEEHAPRFIATTRKLMRADGTLADLGHDVLYRLNTLHIHLPALRERGRDVVELAQHFLAQFSKGGKVLSTGAERVLLGKTWPGNVRELRSQMQRLALLARSDIVEPQDVSPQPPQHPGTSGKSELEAGFDRALAIYYASLDLTTTQQDNLYTHALGALERPLLRNVMAMAAGNQRKAAALLGINRNTLHKKLQQYDLLSL